MEKRKEKKISSVIHIGVLRELKERDRDGDSDGDGPYLGSKRFGDDFDSKICRRLGTICRGEAETGGLERKEGAEHTSFAVAAANLVHGMMMPVL